MTKVLVLGAGRIGVSIAQVLAGTGDFQGTLGEGMPEPPAAGICAMVDPHREGTLPATGFVRQEDTDLDDFIANRFGRVYA